MKLYWAPRTRSIRILHLLEESGLPYESICIDFADRSIRSDPAFRAISPMGKVPAFEDGPARLWDSGAICAYVADQYPETNLAPPIGHPDRGAYLQWVMFNNSVIEPAMAEKPSGIEPNPSTYGWGSWDLMLETFRAGVEPGPWILGDQFTAADVLLGMAAHYLRRFEMLEDDPAIFAYADRVSSRPAFQRALALEAAALE